MTFCRIADHSKQLKRPAEMAEFGIHLVYDQRPDGRFHIHSPSIPGLHLHGADLTLLTQDIEPLVRELLLRNSGVVVDEIKWIPPLEEMSETLKSGGAQHAPFLVITGRRAA